MASDQREQISTPLRQRVDDFKRRSLPVIVWSSCAVIVLVLLLGRASRFEYIGLAEAMEYEISAATSGTVETVVVGLFDAVRAGDVVAKLDDSTVLAAIDTSNAAVRQLRAELDAARNRVLNESGRGIADWTADLRRFQIDEEDRRLAMLSLRVVIESDEIEQERLALELRRLRALLSEGLIGQAEFDNTKLLHDQVQKQIEDNRILLSQTTEEFDTARKRREEYESRLPEMPQAEPLLLPLQEAVAVEVARLGEIQVQRENLILRSPVDGQVSQVLCRRGQSVVPGEPIVMVAERSVQQIVAYLRESDGGTVRENAPVRIVSRSEPRTVSESVVLRVSPNVQALPQRLWRNPQIPDHGRAVVIAAAPSMKLLPGEIVEVEFNVD